MKSFGKGGEVERPPEWVLDEVELEYGVVETLTGREEDDDDEFGADDCGAPSAGSGFRILLNRQRLGVRSI